MLCFHIQEAFFSHKYSHMFCIEHIQAPLLKLRHRFDQGPSGKEDRWRTCLSRTYQTIQRIRKHILMFFSRDKVSNEGSWVRNAVTGNTILRNSEHVVKHVPPSVCICCRNRLACTSKLRMYISAEGEAQDLLLRGH